MAVARSKEYEKDIRLLANIDTDLNWGQKKKFTDKRLWSISTVGDFNPWYDGNLALKDLLNSIESIVEFETSSNQKIQYSEFEHYYKLLRKFNGENDANTSVESDIERIKRIMIDVSTGQARIQDKNSEYQKLYKRINLSYQYSRLKNPNKFSDLWEFYIYWKKYLKSYTKRRAYVAKIYKNLPKPKNNIPITKLKSHSYINDKRLSELKRIKNKNFDLSKLIKYCEEIKLAFTNKSYLSVVMLLRSIINHVPPIFGWKTFSEVANNYNGTKSFKESMQFLDKSLRKISDSYLHTSIRRRELLPNATQVDYSSNLDILLAEICRLLK